MPPKRTSNSASGDKEPAKKSKKQTMEYVNILPENWYDGNKSNMFIGAHVSMAGSIENAVKEAASIGAQSFALFLCNQRTYNLKPLQDEAAAAFKATCKELGYPVELILPHSSYLCNPGAPDSETLSKSRSLFLDGMQRCEKLGIKLYNFHPGSTCGKISVEECIKRIAESIDYVHANTNGVTAVIENMSKQGNTVGGDFKQLKQIIDRVKDKSRVGVCFDTCHAFAAG
jgi:apurinic endonuclease APN1